MSILDEVMESLKTYNPFDIKNYSKLLELYFESPSRENFYDSVNTFNKDKGKNDVTTGTYVEIPHTCSTQMLGTWQVVRFANEKSPTEHRLYVNSPIGITKKIIQVFIDKCTKDNIPFELKYEIDSTDRNDGIVIGSNTATIEKHLEILKKIGGEHPKWIKECGTPPVLTANLNGWIGFADEFVQNKFTSYSRSRMDMFCASISKFLIEHPEIDPLPKETYDYFNEDLGFEYDETGKDKTSNEFKNELENGLSQSFKFHMLNEKNKMKFAKYIKEHPEAITELYTIFGEECKRNGVDPKYPIFNEGSREKLLEVDEREDYV